MFYSRKSLLLSFYLTASLSHTVMACDNFDKEEHSQNISAQKASLEALHPEVMEIIFSHLDEKSLLKFSETSVNIHENKKAYVEHLENILINNFETLPQVEQADIRSKGGILQRRIETIFSDENSEESYFVINKKN